MTRQFGHMTLYCQISDHLLKLLVYNKHFSTWNKMHLESLKLLLYLEKILYPLLKNLDTLQS